MLISYFMQLFELIYPDLCEYFGSDLFWVQNAFCSCHLYNNYKINCIMEYRCLFIDLVKLKFNMPNILPHFRLCNHLLQVIPWGH